VNAAALCAPAGLEMAMNLVDLIPWLPLASMLAFIMIVPLLSEEIPDYEPAPLKRRRDPR
jgi:hypothetical protein